MDKPRPWMPGVCLYHPITTDINILFMYLSTAARQGGARNNPFPDRQDLARKVDGIIANMMENEDEND